MINELNELAIGFDLCSDFSQITFYNRKGSEPMTVSLVPGQEQYQIPTPKDLFSLVEQRSELGIQRLAEFFKEGIALLAGAGAPDGLFFMLTMKRMRPLWADAAIQALGMLGIPAENVYLQDHLESFYYYTMHQKKELRSYNVALFEYERDRIVGYELRTDYHTKPAFVKVEEAFHFYVDAKARSGMGEAQWQEEKDRLFLEKLQEMFQGKTYSSAYLLGEGFDKSWAKRSLTFLCSARRHVFMGQNLFSKGACYGAMVQCGMSSIRDYLYAGPDMIEYNIGMEMLIRGNAEYYPMISAGINWYMARHECEFILDDTQELEFYSRHLNGTQMAHTVTLTDLPPRPNRATRIRLRMDFIAKNRCRVRMEDLGLGGLYPSSGKQWEAVIAL
ncbi:MAG: DUF5716 family protein [Eubacteriales bacterium]|nr:DUF5716 family protein [Eubacteriales bacterium]